MQPSQARRAALLLALGMLLSSQGTGVAAQAASPAPPGDSSPSAASPSPPANAPPPSPSTSPPAESPPPPPSPPPTPQPASPEGSPPPASPQPPPPPDSPPVSPSPSPPSPASPSPGCDVTNTTAGDMCSLLQFKGALSQASELDNWDAASSDPCSWTGVSCYSGLTRVQNLTLSKLNLTGTLPTAWVAPMLLSSLALSGNSLSGTLPSSWTLPACCLGTLDLTINTLSGTLPAGVFSGLQALRQLLLGKNQLSGSLPALSVLAPGLTTLGLSNNRFNGSFPSGWALPASLTTLDISDNQLTGPFLAGWSLPASLAYCDISGNQLTGSLGLAVLPEGLGQLKMGSNNLTGAIPATFIPPNSQLTYLEMDNNHFAGALPDNLSMPLLQNAYFQSNSLTGELPANWEVPSEAKVRVLPQDTTGPCGSVPGTPEFYNAATNSQLTQGSLPACGSSPSPAPPPPVSPSPSSPSPAPPPAPAPPPSPSPSGGGSSSSSTTTIIAAAAGGGAALAIIAALLLWWYVRRRRRRAGELAAAGTDSPLKKGGGSSEAHSVEEGLPYEEEEGPSDSQLGSHPGQPLNDVFLKLAVNAKLASLATTDSEGGASEPPSAPGSATVPSSSAPSLSPRPGGHLTGGNVMDPQLWTIPFEDLDMQRQIGEGSFGRVYLAKWQETLVAVKVLLGMAAAIAEDDENALLQQTAALTFSSPVLESLQKESALMCRLRHPNVVSFLGVCKAPPCVVTEYCSRGSLTDVLRAARQSPAAAARLDWARRLNMMLDTAKGMLHLHSTTPPIIHRDLKSPNLLVDAHWRVKISDFNLSKIMEESAVMSSVAATNPRWLAPEILSGHPASFASDVYAFGIVMWETATWDIPWAGENPWQLVTIVTEGGRLPVPPPAQLPGPDSDEFAGVAAAYLDLMRRCWAQQPETRPAFTEVITVLRELLEQAVKRGKRPVTAAPQHGEPPSGSLTPTLVRRGGAGHNSLTDQQLPATPESSQTASDPRTITPLLGSL